VFLRYLAFQKVGARHYRARSVGRMRVHEFICERKSHCLATLIAMTAVKSFIVAITFQLFLHLRDAYEFGGELLAPKFLRGFCGGSFVGFCSSPGPPSESFRALSSGPENGCIYTR